VSPTYDTQGDQLSIEKLDPLVLRQDSGVGEARELLHREESSLYFDRHSPSQRLLQAPLTV
jgi:hypothetical protein